MGAGLSTTFAPIVLNAANTPGFFPMVAAGRVVFRLHPCMAAFASRSHVRVSTVRPRAQRGRRERL